MAPGMETVKLIEIPVSDEEIERAFTEDDEPIPGSLIVWLSSRQIAALKALGVFRWSERRCGCGQWFVPRHGSQMTCNPSCRDRERVRRWRKRKAEGDS